MVSYPRPGEPSGDSYIVERVGSIDGKFAQTTLALLPIWRNGIRTGFRYQRLRISGFKSQGGHDLQKRSI